MRLMTGAKIGFRSAVLRTHREILGEVPLEVLEFQLSREALADPLQFVKEMSEIFGEATRAMYLSIERNTEEAVRLDEEEAEPVPAATAVKEQLRRSLIGSRTYSGNARTPVLLHDQRIKDESGTYASDADLLR